MEVYNIDEMIDKLKQYQTWHGLKYLSRDSIQRIIEDTAQDVPYSPGVPESIKNLEKYIKNNNLQIHSKTEIAKALNVSRSTVYKWFENGIITTFSLTKILIDLKELENEKGTRVQLKKIVERVSSIMTSENEFKMVGVRNCMELLGVEPVIFKKLRRNKYITSKTLRGIHDELKRYYMKSWTFHF